MQSFLLTGRPPVKTGHQLPNGVWSGRMFRMKRTIRILAGLVACRAVSVLGQVPSLESPWEMAVATERWLVEGAGALFLPGMDDPARDGNTFVFVDESWPAAFQMRVGASVYLRVSPDTGCYEFEDANGNVFWTIVPYAPLTWNWISPFRSPFHPDAQGLYSPFRLVREWRLTTPEIEEMRMVPMRRAPLRSTPPEPVTNLCFTAFSITNDVLFFTVDWPTNNVLPESTLDLYGTSNLASRTWSFLSSHPATNRPASFSVPMTALPWYDPAPPHVHGEACGVSTNIVLSPLDGGIVYTNVVYECGVSDPPRSLGFFNLGTRNDTDGDSLTDAFELLVSKSDPAMIDTDLDGLSDGRENDVGTDPCLADTDGDGLTDSSEASWIVVETNGLSRWIDTSSLTNRIVLWTEFDGQASCMLSPVPFRLFGHSLSNLSVNANGIVWWSESTRSIGSGRHWNDFAGNLPISSGPCVTVARFWDDLYADASATASVSVAGVETNGVRIAVIEFLRAGFFEGSTNDAISFQIQFSDAESNIVHVVFAESSGLGTGSSATLGFRASLGSTAEYSRNENGTVFPGLSLAYHIGFGTNPHNSDTDGDGLSDSTEIDLETNPLNADPDGDGLTDAEEVAIDTDPLDSDTDDDGLGDGDEIAVGTDPFDPDSDDDLLSDGWEVENGTDPFDALDALMDGDGDGLALAQEIAMHRTDPQCWDTDGDGLSDGDEVVRGTHPLLWDTDRDGLPDGLEVELGTDPVARDSDEDGIPDGWEHDHAPFDPLVPFDGLADADGDGLSNADEISIHGTDWQSADTDGDGIADTNEVAAGTDPLLWDTDGDGIADLAEATLGTSATSSDTDGDGCPEGWEVRYGFDPLSAASPVLSVDPDGDGLSNLNDARHGTSPFLADTDGDGISDSTEIATGTNPLAADTDGDGLSDGDEVARGTDPLLWDTDGDGLFDGDEAASGMDPATPNGDDEAFDADSDGDGLTNAEEFQIGTDWSVEDTDGDGVSDGIEWRQGSNPLDSADFSVRPGVDVTLKFGDNSGSHSERYEATVKPAGGDTRRPFTLRNGTFGVADSFTVRLVANAWYDISLRHVASSLAQPDLDYTLTIIPYNSLSGTAPLVLDPGGLLGNHSNVYASQFDCTARVAIVHARILADKNRDGVIDDADNTPDPLRMWINDDRDDGSIASGESDVPAPSFLGHTYGNATDDHVNGMSDLEDYFPVWLDVAESITLLQSLYPDSRVSVHLSQRDAAVGIVNTDLTRMTAGQYLRDPTIAADYASSTDVIVGSAGVEYPASDLSRLTGNSGKGVSLIEGLKSSKRPLVLELRKDGSTVLSTSLELSISSVESFYRWINLRGVVGGDVSRSTDTREPQNFPDEESNGRSVVFVHGFNVTEREARGWHAEMFKRLWQSGCSSRYYAVTWNGDEGFPNGLFYHKNVVNAFLTAPAFATSFSGNVANTAVLAHSLGNMVVCSAIQDHGCLPSQYFMLDSAVAAESLDATQWDDSSFCNPMLHEEWFGYPGGCWCSRWHQLFSGNDVRQNLTWIDRFGDVPDRTELFNYYSTGDEVLCLYETPDANGIGTITVEGGTGGSIGYHPWQKQERFKGRFGVDAWLGNAGTSEMGWGFSGIGFWEDGEPPMYDESIGLGALYGIPARLSQYTATQAVNATSEQLVADPVFRHSPETILSGGNQSQSQIDALLARGVPALSGPVGSRAILLNSSVVNTDMNSKRVSVGWPRNSEPEFTGWRHGDIKAVAFPFVHRVFDDILQSLEANK